MIISLTLSWITWLYILIHLVIIDTFIDVYFIDVIARFMILIYFTLFVVKINRKLSKYLKIKPYFKIL